MSQTPEARLKPTVTIDIRHYVAKEDRWIDKETVKLPDKAVAAFLRMIGIESK